MNAKLLSVLLEYPDEDLIDARPSGSRRPRSCRATSARRSSRWSRDGDDAARRAATGLRRDVRLRRRCGLHLTYHTHGDRRQRGLELVRLKRRYAEAGHPFEGAELPDYLPVMLEFASLRPEEGTALLASLRAPLELVRAALHDRGSLHAGVLDALCHALPQPTARQLEEARRLAEEGPPAELVGLEPFGAPELAEVGA